VKNLKLKTKTLVLFLIFTSSLGFGKTIDLLTVFIEMGKKVDPAVVNIATTQMMHGGRGGGGGGYGYPGMPMPNDPFRQFFEEFMGPQGMQPQQEEKVQSLGSGFIIDADGLIVTNNHVIQGASDIQVQLTEASKKTYKAKVIGADKRTDIALIKISAEKPLPFVTLGDSDKVQKGEWVGVFGNPFGYGHSESKGIISSKDRSIELENANYPFLQTDANINPGNSGGPMVNTSSEVIGVNSAIDARAQGIGFAIPINIVKRLLPQLKANGKIVHGFLGVGINTVDEKMAKQLNLKTDHGAIVLSVSPGSPAQKAGIQPYDILVTINGKSIDSARDLTNFVAESSVGSVLTLGLIREGKSKSVKAKITERPDELAQNNSEDESPETQGTPHGVVAPFNLGFYIADLTPQIVKQLELQDVPAKGVVVTAVRQGSLADQAGIQVGDVILDVNRRTVKTARETVKSLKKGTDSLRILRGNATLIIFMDTK
jgi:serine protease Do